MSQIQTQQVVIDSIAQIVCDSSDIHAITARVLDVIHAYLQTIFVCIYAINEQKQIYHLLKSHSSCDDISLAKNVDARFYTSSPLFNSSEPQRQPFLIEDAQESKYSRQMFNIDSLKSKPVGSIVSVPLWFASRCEGILTVSFNDVVPHDDSRLPLLLAIGTYIAAALSQARLTAAKWFAGDQHFPHARTA